MISSLKPTSSLRTSIRRLLLIVILSGAGLLAVLLLVLPILPGERGLSIQLNDVASQDVLAPRSIVFVSSVLTAEAQEKAIAQVSPVYDPPDPRIARQQAEALHSALAYISIIRADLYASPEQKLDDIKSLAQVSLSADTAQRILQLGDLDWDLLQAESETVLEQIMRQQIRPERVKDVQNSLPAYISLTIPVEQAELVTELVRSLIVPNSLYNEAETAALREQASQAVLPVTRSFVPGQVVIVRGQVVTAAGLEAVEALGLATGLLNFRTAGSLSLTVLLILVILILFAKQYHPEAGRTLRVPLLISLLFLTFIVVARLMVPGHTVLPFLFPVAAFALVMSALVGPGFGQICGLLLAVLTGLLGGNQLEIALYGGLGSVAAVLALSGAEKPVRFLTAGLAASIVGFAVILIVRLREPATDMVGILTLAGASLVNGLLSGSLALGTLFVAGLLFDVTTNLHLLELSRPDHPLLRILLREAPGTYQHSLQVANLSEAAGERIGANTLLLRVGALFHDCGKTMRPKFFVENQGPEGNPHDHMDPQTSVQLIRQHIQDGIDLARKYRLPTKIRDLIPEHHGTLRANYQYGAALKAADGDETKVDEAQFRYPGPRPQSREAAILMLADGVEAKFRAVRPATLEEIETLVRGVIEDRISQRQFDETAITLKDLDQIGTAFTESLRGSVHPRLLYPDDEQKNNPSPTPA